MNQKWNKKWALSAAVILASGLSGAPTAIHAATAVSGTESNTNGASATDGTPTGYSKFGISTAVGDKAEAETGGTAVGSEAKASVFGTALGNGASAGAGIAVGYLSSSSSSGIAVGNYSSSKWGDSIAIGLTASSEVGIAIGNRAKTTDPGSDKDYSSIAIGCEATSNSGIAIGHKATSNGGLAMGIESVSTGYTAIAIGYRAQAKSWGSVAVGEKSVAETGSSTAIGNDTTAKGYGSTALGSDIHVYDDEATGVGHLSLISGVQSVGVGRGVQTIKAYATAIGGWSEVDAEEGVALGRRALVRTETATRSVALGAESIVTEEDTVSVGNATKYEDSQGTIQPFTRKIVNVTDGAANTDAATYGQLVNAQAVTTTSGEGESQTTNTTYTPYTADSDGIVTVLTNNGGTAFKIKVGTSGGGGESYTGDNKTISISDKNVISVKMDGAVEKDNAGIVTGGTVYNSMITNGSYDSTTGKLHFTNGKGENAFSVAIEGTGVIYKGDEKTIALSDNNEFSVKYDATDLTVNDSGLAVKKDGKVESGNTGLVTGGTVYDALQDMNNRTEALTNDINKVGAGAAALAALRPEGFDPNDKWSFAVGYGHYKNANAGALGAFFKPNADMTVSFSSTVGNGDPMMNAGVSFKLGSRGKNAGAYRNAVDLVARVDALEATDARHEAFIAAQQKEIAAQAQEIQELKAQVAALMQHAGLSASVLKTAAL